MPKSTSRKKTTPRRVLALPELEHAKTAGLNSLTSVSGQRTYDHAIRESSPGTVRSLVSLSTAPLYSGTGFTSNSADTRRLQSIFGSLPSGASRTRRPTPAS